MRRFDYYIGLTEQLNTLINPKEKPFLLMEGLVDHQVDFQMDRSNLSDRSKVILYAGGIYEQFGVKMLLDAFRLIKFKDVELHVYGSGDLDQEMNTYTTKDRRIKYFGEVENSFIVEKLKHATLLINPRPTIEDFTKYSFPSKNLEYMLSGTPLLTTKLPGMPKEYYNYVYIIEEETIDGMRRSIEELLCKSSVEMRGFGYKAYTFVQSKKSNKIQAKRVIDFLGN